MKINSILDLKSNLNRLIKYVAIYMINDMSISWE